MGIIWWWSKVEPDKCKGVKELRQQSQIYFKYNIVRGCFTLPQNYDWNWVRIWSKMYGNCSNKRIYIDGSRAVVV